MGALDDLLRLELGVGDGDLRLLAGGVADLLRRLLRGDERLLQRALAAPVLRDLLGLALVVLAQREVLLHERLELGRDEREERLHLLRDEPRRAFGTASG